MAVNLFKVTTFAPATDKKDARLVAREFRAPACVVGAENIDAFTLDVQNNINYVQRARISLALNAVNAKMDSMNADSTAYDKAWERSNKLSARLADFDNLATCGHTFTAGLPALFAWAVFRATRKLDSKTEMALNYDIELLRAVYDAADMSAENIESLRLSVIGFMRYHTRNMNKYGKVFDIRFTTNQAWECACFARSVRYNWNARTIAERETTDNEVIAHIILSALRKTFRWDVENIKRAPSRVIID